MFDTKEYEVEIVTTRRNCYFVTARSPEEAVSIAEQLLLEDGDEGQADPPLIESSDAYPVEEDLVEGAD